MDQVAGQPGLGRRPASRPRAHRRRAASSGCRTTWSRSRAGSTPWSTPRTHTRRSVASARSGSTSDGRGAAPQRRPRRTGGRGRAVERHGPTTEWTLPDGGHHVRLGDQQGLPDPDRRVRRGRSAPTRGCGRSTTWTRTTARTCAATGGTSRWSPTRGCGTAAASPRPRRSGPSSRTGASRGSTQRWAAVGGALARALLGRRRPPLRRVARRSTADPVETAVGRRGQPDAGAVRPARGATGAGPSGELSTPGGRARRTWASWPRRRDGHLGRAGGADGARDRARRRWRAGRRDRAGCRGLRAGCGPESSLSWRLTARSVRFRRLR